MRRFLALTILAAVALAGCMQDTAGDLPDDERNEMVKKEAAKLKHLQGLEACQRGDYEAAADLFLKAIELQEKPVYFNNLGRALYWTGRYDLALRAFMKAKEEAPDDPEVLTNIGDLLRQVGKTDDAIDYYHKAIAAGDRTTRAEYELGHLFLEKRRYEDAEYRLMRVLKQQPEMEKAHLSMMILYNLIGRYGKAYKQLKYLERRGYKVSPDLEAEIYRGYERMLGEKRGDYAGL